MAFFLGEDFDDIACCRGASQMVMKDLLDQARGEIMPHEEGRFLSEDELKAHFRRMQKKYPQIYKQSDHVFGTADGRQHPMNTKLMTYFDDDPSKPMRVIVKGSHFFIDGLGGDPMPYYVVQFRGETSLERIHHDGAHGEDCPWKVGWDIDDDEVEKAGAVAGEGGAASSSYRWIFNEFGGKDLDEHENILSSGEISLSKVVLEIVRSFVFEGAGGVIVENEGKTKFQAIEFGEPKKYSTMGSLVTIQYAVSPERDRAEIFLRGEEVRNIRLPDAIALRLEQHILNGCKGNGLHDLPSGLLIYEGYLVPGGSKPYSTDKEVPKLGNVIEDVNFGIELEFSCAIGIPQKEMSERLQRFSYAPVRIASDCGKGGGSSKSNGVQINSSSNKQWELVRDRSLRPKFEQPNSNLLELRSRILRGQNGLHECQNVVRSLTQIASVQMNHTMGLHVHISIEGLSESKMIKACRTFVEYEDEIDSFMAQSRRNDRKMSKEYFKSNKAEILKRCPNFCGDETKVINHQFESCKTVHDICELMNPGGDRYFKLNLQNVRLNRRPTFEFRQHRATADLEKITAWVIFCMALVHDPDRISDYFGRLWQRKILAKCGGRIESVITLAGKENSEV